MILQGEKIKLRYFEPSDLEDMFQVMSHPKVMRFSLSGPYTWEKTKEFLDFCQSEYIAKGTGLFAVLSPPDERVIGYCGFYFHEIDGVPEVEVGYRLHPDFWGRSIATKSAGLVRDYGFAHHRFSRLISIIDPENIASIRVAEKIGMIFLRSYLFKGKALVSIYGVDNPALLGRKSE